VSLRTRWLLAAMLFVAVVVLAVRLQKAADDARQRYLLAQKRLETARRVASMQRGDLEGLLGRLERIAPYEKKDLGAAVELRFSRLDRLKSERILAALLSSAVPIEELRMEREKDRCLLRVKVSR